MLTSWVEPVCSSGSDKRYAALVCFPHSPRRPSEFECHVLARASNLVQLAIEKKRSQEAVQRYEFIASAVPDLMTVVNREYRYESVNRAWSEAIGRSQADAIGMPVFDQWTATDAAQMIRSAMESCFENQHAEYSAWMQFGQKGRRYCRVNFHPYVASGEVTHAVIVTHDATEEHQARHALQAAKEAAESAARAKGDFLATMSHEIRTPLNGLLGMLELLQQSKPSKQQAQFLEIARASSDQLLSLVNDILDFSKIEAGKLSLEHTRFDLITLVEEISTGAAL